MELSSAVVTFWYLFHVALDYVVDRQLCGWYLGFSTKVPCCELIFQIYMSKLYCSDLSSIRSCWQASFLSNLVSFSSPPRVGSFSQGISHYFYFYYYFVCLIVSVFSLTLSSTLGTVLKHIWASRFSIKDAQTDSVAWFVHCVCMRDLAGDNSTCSQPVFNNNCFFVPVMFTVSY